MKKNTKKTAANNAAETATPTNPIPETHSENHNKSQDASSPAGSTSARQVDDLPAQVELTEDEARAVLNYRRAKVPMGSVHAITRAEYEGVLRRRAELEAYSSPIPYYDAFCALEGVGLELEGFAEIYDNFIDEVLEKLHSHVDFETLETYSKVSHSFRECLIRLSNQMQNHPDEFFCSYHELLDKLTKGSQAT